MDNLTEQQAAKIITVAWGCTALAVLFVGLWLMWGVIDRAIAAFH